MPIAYILIFIGIMIIIGFFWFLQGNNSFHNGQHMPVNYNKETNAQELLLVSGLKKIDIYSDRGKWLLFLTIFLLLIEFFIFMAFLIKNAGMSLDLIGNQHLYFFGALIYFFLLIISIFLSIRLTTTARELPHLSDGFAWPRAIWNQKISELSTDQKEHLSYFVLEKGYLLEQSYSIVLILISISITLLVTWLSYWLFSIVN